MTRAQARTAGWLAGGAGVGVLAWALYPSIARSLSGVTPLRIDFQPQQPAAGAAWQATVTAKGSPGAQIAAQGVVVQPDAQVGGHLWASAAIAAAVSAQYWSVYDATSGSAAAQAAAAEAAVASSSADPTDRLAVATAGSDGTVQLSLYSEPLAAGAYAVLVFVGPARSGLLASDPVGTAGSALQRSPVPFLAVTLELPPS